MAVKTGDQIQVLLNVQLKANAFYAPTATTHIKGVTFHSPPDSYQTIDSAGCDAINRGDGVDLAVRPFGLSGTQAAGNCTFTLTAGTRTARQDVTATATQTATGPAGGSFTDSVPSNNTATVSLAIQDDANAHVAMDFRENNVPEMEASSCCDGFTYVAHLSSLSGTVHASHTVITLPAPVTAQTVSTGAGGGTCTIATAQKVVCDLPDITVGSPRDIVIGVFPGDVYDNRTNTATAVVTSDDHETDAADNTTTTDVRWAAPLD